jgi:hypothetical protein
MFEVAVPLLVTGLCFDGCPPEPNTDPAYFYSDLHPAPPGTNPINTGIYTAFKNADRGVELSPPNPFPLIGLAPTAGPLGAPPTSGSANFALCASLPVTTNGSTVQLRAGVGAYYAMATSGEMLLSAPLPAASSSVCPLL